MALETPKWLQGGTYAARLDRHVIEELFRSKNRVLRGFQVTERGAGADFTVDITAGSAVILGTTQADQGAYLVRSTDTENLAVPGTQPTASVDTIYVAVNDPNAGGPAGDDFEFVYVAEGDTPPNDSIAIATISRTPDESAILQSAITDIAPRGAWSWTVGTGVPTHNAPEGDLYVQVS